MTALNLMSVRGELSQACDHLLIGHYLPSINGDKDRKIDDAIDAIRSAVKMLGLDLVTEDDAEFFGIGMSDKSEPFKKISIEEYKRRIDGINKVAEDDRDLTMGR